MSFSEWEPDFSYFSINLTSIFDPIFSDSNSESNESESESDFSSVFINLKICIFFSPYIYTLLNKSADGFFYLFSWQNQ